MMFMQLNDQSELLIEFSAKKKRKSPDTGGEMR